jgi:hypothetical protein
MPTAADDLWRDDRREVSEGLMNAATGIAFGIGLGLSAWAALIVLVRVLIG